MQVLKFVKIQPEAIIPSRKHGTDSGLDISSAKECAIAPRGMLLIPTGIGAIIPRGYELQVRPRSGLSSKGILGVFGTVDEGYRGEIGVILYNFRDEEFCIHKGDRIAQLVLSPVVHHIPVETGTLEQLCEHTERGEDGFGSTGMKG